MIWPKRPGSWNYGAKKAREAFKRVAWAIAESEEVFMLAEPDVEENAREMLAGNPGHEIHVIRMESDDAWARDVAPTFVVNGEGAVRLGVQRLGRNRGWTLRPLGEGRSCGGKSLWGAWL